MGSDAHWALAFGVFAWLYSSAIGLGGVGEITLIDSLLLLAVVAVVPAAAPLHPGADRIAERWLVLAGLPVCAAVLLPRGALATVLALPWAAVTALGLGVSATTWWRGARRLPDLAWPVSAGFLLVGAGWLLLDRAGLEPLGFRQPLVQLTAVHFHYAGFVATVLTLAARRRRPDRRAAGVAVACLVLGSPLVAVGFAVAAVLQVVGAVVLTVGLYLLAWVTVRDVAPGADARPRVLLWVSSGAVLVPMLLALSWVAGTVWDAPALSIPAMVRIHGVLNALGFAAAGVAGWRLLDASAPGPSPAAAHRPLGQPTGGGG